MMMMICFFCLLILITKVHSGVIPKFNSSSKESDSKKIVF